MLKDKNLLVSHSEVTHFKTELKKCKTELEKVEKQRDELLVDFEENSELLNNGDSDVSILIAFVVIKNLSLT